MPTDFAASRRSFLRTAGMLSGGALACRYAPGGLIVEAFQANTPDAMRTQMGAAPIVDDEARRSASSMLSGPGGNVIVFHGPDGKVVVDGFVKPAWPKLKAALAAIDGAPIKSHDRHALAFRSRRQQRATSAGGRARA